MGFEFPAISQTILTEDFKSKPYCDCETNFYTPDSLNGISAGTKVLETGYTMALISKSIVQGSCWDFVNEVYRRAGFKEAKKTVFKSKKSGPFALATMVQPGDWIYHINHEFRNNEHSAIFVCWKDFKRRIAITLSYAGMNKSVPGKYGEYSLTSIYSIFRPSFPYTKL